MRANVPHNCLHDRAAPCNPHPVEVMCVDDGEEGILKGAATYTLLGRRELRVASQQYNVASAYARVRACGRMRACVWSTIRRMNRYRDRTLVLLNSPECQY